MKGLLTALMAGGGGASGGSMTTTFITFGLIIVIFYFLIIRPQKKRDKAAKDMLAAMKKGDKVVSIGGIRGTIVTVKESTVVVKVDDNTRLEFSKSAIAQILDKTAEVAKKETPVATDTVKAPAKKKATPAPKKSEEETVVVEETPEESKDDADKNDDTK
ncbi:MAG TPA: preprotein translocase subunit YajC [Spirochaetales bacterium]|jgi:preprotein translocase subunit YajC|nr:preprotein translocase subunit YajC [Spirochaetales bacterium]